MSPRCSTSGMWYSMRKRFVLYGTSGYPGTMGRCQLTDFWLFDRLFRLVLPLRRFLCPVPPTWPVLPLTGLFSVLRSRLDFASPVLELAIAALGHELFVDVAVVVAFSSILIAYCLLSENSLSAGSAVRIYYYYCIIIIIYVLYYYYCAYTKSQYQQQQHTSILENPEPP